MKRYLVLPVFVLTSCQDSGNPEESSKPDEGASSGSIVSQPLGERSVGGEGQSMFTSLTAETTGVDFENRIVEDHRLKHLYATEKVCGGVAVGDVNGDGRPDLFFTSGPEKNRLYLQTGDLKFEDATAAAKLESGDVWSSGVAMVDVEGDGDLDLYVANYGSPNHLFVNDGKGVFIEKAKEFGLAHVSASHMPAFCDYDRDGDLDLYLLTNRFHSPKGQPLSGEALRFSQENGTLKVGFSDPELGLYFRPYQAGTQDDGRPIFKIKKVAQQDVLFRNDGKGGFTNVSKEAGIYGTGFGLSATWWDFNQDGWPDLWVGNDFDDPDRVYRNNGDGTFTDIVKEVTPHTSWFSMGADFGDLNHDLKPDFLIADMSGTSHYKQKVNMGSMGANAEFLRDAFPQQYMRNALFLGTGQDRFWEGAQMAGLANSDWTWTVKLSDFDCDGMTDVYITNGMSKNFNESDNDAVLPLPNETEWDRHVRAGTEELKEQNLAFRNEGDLKFSDVSKSWGLDHVGMSFGGAHADLDRDGDLDLIVCNLGEPAGIYRNDAGEGNRMLIKLKGRGANRDGLGTRLELETADGKIQMRELTLVRGYLASNEPLVHFGLGASDPVRLTLHWPEGQEQEFTNLKSNHFYTITAPEAQGDLSSPTTPADEMFEEFEGLAGVKHQENEFDDFSKQLLLPNQMSRLGPGQAWGDFDQDGDDDLWVSGAAESSGQLWRNDGNGKFSQVSSEALKADAASEDMGGLWFDADGDGDVDLYVVSGGYEFSPDDSHLGDRLYLNNGGTLTRAESGTLPAKTTSGGAVAAADVDRDGDLDLFVAGRQLPESYPEPTTSSLLVNEGGKFTASPLEVEGMITSVLWSDVNQDGWIDLILTQEWGPVRTFQNKEGELTEVTGTSGIEELKGWWNGMTAGDFDGDGDLDLVVTNFGLNTKYKASIKKPALIYYGDFEGDRRKRIVEAKFEDKHLYPVRGRSCSSTSMPHLRKAFNTYKDFAIAELPEIYSPTTLDDSLKLSATVLEAGVFLNESSENGEIKFVFSPLPRIAQIAPSFGVVASDVDGDGNLDLYLAQNFESPQVETGHMSGGVSQLLLGDGKGGFSPVSPDKSGLVVGGDASSLTQVDLNGDGDDDFLVAVNNGPVKAFLNNSGQKSLKIRLQGSKGNPSAIGALVTVQGKDGRSWVREMRAGGGYLSQSPAEVTFKVPSGESASRVSIRWPDGSQSEHELKSNTGVLEIAQQK